MALEKRTCKKPAKDHKPLPPLMKSTWFGVEYVRFFGTLIRGSLEQGYPPEGTLHFSVAAQSSENAAILGEPFTFDSSPAPVT